MPTLSLVSYVVGSDDENYSRITDLEIVEVGGISFLYSGTRYDGVVQEWSINDGTVALADQTSYLGGDFAGSVAGLTQFDLTSGPILLTGGSASGGLQTFAVNVDGSLGATSELNSLPSEFAGFQNGEAVALASGSIAFFGSLAGQSGLARIVVTQSGVIESAETFSTNAQQTSQISALKAAEVGGQALIVTASSAGSSLTAWSVDATGDVTSSTTINADDGLWINAPSALAVAAVGASTYAILGAAGTDSISVVELNADGSMAVRDHVLDARDTRFGGVTSLEVITVDDQTYVVAAGADDGISVFALLEGGLLVHLASIEDTDDVGLDNISDVVGLATTTGFELFAASSSEPGITKVAFENGARGMTATATLGGGLLSGTAGSDVLQGHDGDDVISAGAGNDIVRDGEGSDMMSGGAGADVFVLSRDGATDTITDFEVGIDRLDLSLWPMLRDISQLFITIQDNGMRIAYGDEVLFVQSANGAPIDYRFLGTTDLIGLSRLPLSPEPGYPGPATPPNTGAHPSTPPDQGGPYNPLSAFFIANISNLGLVDEEAGTANLSGIVVDGTDASEILMGSDGMDFITGGDGEDAIFGEDGDDLLFGRFGNDRLSGGKGADRLLGGRGDDEIFGNDGHDRLEGGDGADVISGGLGNDLLWGGDGADNFVFESGADTIVDFEQGTDTIRLDPNLWTGLTSSADVLFVYGTILQETVTIDFENGSVLTIIGVSDFETLADDIFLF